GTRVAVEDLVSGEILYSEAPFAPSVADKTFTLTVGPKFLPYCAVEYKGLGDLVPGSASAAFFAPLPSKSDAIVQCDIWTYDPETLVLTPTWVNSDGTTTSLLAWSYRTGYRLIGDYDEYVNDPQNVEFGPFYRVQLKLIVDDQA
ncbi:hypothetical protein FRB99_005013, partial [Tulasnella sp. 403]